MVKALLYVLTLIISIWLIDSININSFIKQGRIYQARLIYLILAICTSYLVTNFLYDFFINFQIIK